MGLLLESGKTPTIKPNNMKSKNIIITSLTLALLATALAGCECEGGGKHHKHCSLAAQAKISRADAEKAALAKVPGGTIKDAELEKEDGKLIWSFDIATPGSADITEVAVCAMSGAVISVEKETPEQQAKEKAEDEAKEKKHKKDKDDEKEEKGEHKD